MKSIPEALSVSCSVSHKAEGGVTEMCTSAHFAKSLLLQQAPHFFLKFRKRYLGQREAEKKTGRWGNFDSIPEPEYN